MTSHRLNNRSLSGFVAVFLIILLAVAFLAAGLVVGSPSPADAAGPAAKAPVISHLDPASGPQAGANLVVIKGTNLGNATSVKFGSTNAWWFWSQSNSVFVLAPAGTGTVDVTVTTRGGTSSTAGTANDYTYVAAPSVSTVEPSAGSTSGGNTVILTGTNFTGATLVRFDFVPASFRVDSPTQITVTKVPGHWAGTVDVRVTTTGGTSADTSADNYRYVAPPTVLSLSPSKGPAAGGNSVVIRGDGFTGATSVKFGSKVAGSFTVNSDSKITAVAPLGSGTVDVTVTGPGGTSAKSWLDRYTYQGTPPSAPTVTVLSPKSGPTLGGTSVTITGSGLSGATGVKFGTTSAQSFTVNSATKITAISPAGTGTVDVSVTTLAGTSLNTAADDFSYTLSVPQVTTWPTASAITLGEALSEATLTGGEASVAGAFAFTDPTTVPGSAGVYSASVTFTPTDSANYETVVGSVDVTVNAVLIDLSGATIAPIADQTYSGLEITPDPVVTLGAATLVKDSDYSVAYADNTGVGTGTLTIAGLGNYTGTKSATFQIVKATPTVTTWPTASAASPAARASGLDHSRAARPRSRAPSPSPTPRSSRSVGTLYRHGRLHPHRHGQLTTP